MKKLLVALLFSGSAFAGTLEQAAEVMCDYQGSQREMNACAIRDYKASDADLNAVYKKKLAKLSVKQREALKAQQRQWIQRRDARCSARKTGEGTNTTIDYLTCLESMTEVRTLQLLR